MTIEEVDAARRKAGRSIGELCRTAGIARSTYQFAISGQKTPFRSTLQKLQRALGRPPGPIRPPQRDVETLRALYRAYVVIVAKELGHEPEKVLASQPQSRANASAEWREAAHVRALAVYGVTIDIGVSGARVGRAVGLTRQAVSDINKRVEDFRDDPQIDALLERVGALVSGRTQ